MKEVIGTRCKGLSKQKAFAKGLNFAGISYTPRGNTKFPNGEHKGYDILSEGYKIGVSDSLQNISNLLVIEGKIEGLSIQGSKELLRFIGGLEILPEYSYLFAESTLERFKGVEFNKSNTLSAAEFALKAKTLRKRKRIPMSLRPL
jgi:hypothetical protein